MEKARRITAIIVSVLILITIWLGWKSFSKMWEDDLIIPGNHVTEVKWLSQYHPWLKGTRGDTRIFIIDSGKPGATIAVSAGVHPDEQAGTLAALILVEKIEIEAGKLVVIPQMNNSALTHSFPQEATPQYIKFKTADGQTRIFRGGSRGTNPIDYWPDPEVFSHYQTGQKLSGEEVRNLNRNFPGRSDGHFTEQVAYAIFKALKDEKVDFNIDLHEAWPEYPFVNAMGADEKSADLASLSALDLRMQGIEIGVEAAAANFRGLTYREYGEYIKQQTGREAGAVLAETPNASQGRFRGITDEKLIIEGKDSFYEKASKLGRTFVKFDSNGWPLNVRVARNLALIDALAKTYSEMNSDKPLVFSTMPSYDEIATKDIGHFLNSPSKYPIY